MDQCKGWLALLLVAVALALASTFFVSGGTLPATAVAAEPAIAPLFQATDTPTPTSTPTPTNTPTPTPTRDPLTGVFHPAGDPPLGYRAEPLGDGTFAASVSQPRGYSTAVMVAATVAATPATTPVLAANPRRVYLLCTNDSGTSPVYLGFGATAAVGQGARLNTAGGSYEMSGGQQSVYSGAIYAAATQTTSAVFCLEGSR